MKYIKLESDKKSFNFVKMFGADIINLQEAEDIDKKIEELVNNSNKQIVISNELSFFSQDIVKKYKRFE